MTGGEVFLYHLPNQSAQPSLGNDFWIQHAQTSGCGVAGVGEPSLTACFTLLIDGVQISTVNDDLCAQREVARVTDGEREVANGAQVFHDFFAHFAIAARTSPREAAGAIEDLHAGAVQFWLDAVDHLCEICE